MERLELHELRGEPVNRFLAELETVYERHGMSLSHEDTEGGFIVEPYSEANVAWLRQARDEVTR
jgi:hypothetical protein